MTWVEIVASGLGAGITAGVVILLATLPAQVAHRIATSLKD